MVQDYLRRVVGYNKYYITTGGGAINAGASFTIDLASGPGEFLGFTIYHYGGADASYVNALIELKADAVVIYGGVMRDLLGCAFTTAFHNLFATNDVIAADAQVQSFKSLIPYESTMSVKFTNNGANQVGLAMLVHHRVYR